MSGVWFNNVSVGPSPLPSFAIANAICLALGIIIMAHSSYVLRKANYAGVIPWLAETSALGGIFTSVANLVYYADPFDPLRNGICENILTSAVFNLMIQLPDNLLFLYAYFAFSTVAMKKKRLTTISTLIIFLYYALVLVLPFLLPPTLLPLFINENTDYYQRNIGYPLALGNTIGYVIYNIVFSLVFARILYRIYFDRTSLYPKIAREISIKCLLHLVIR